ncbi:type III pantothenate kinase [Amphritea sp. 1_MG-2023]|uniref:type III pantothenate kinase n=1 Tax=Amphritea sp. 1_MG-2023 TaxID=3062670 RepID=UPI0026E3869A|nr:type III pantothenate kinase [Amphritea sp. 1_MG-2023]MDO6565202.1 type III pantothenate kinase [Amphritea sp. 1_MG-2023]
MNVLDLDAGNTFIKWRLTGTDLRGRLRHTELANSEWPERVARVRIASVAGSEVNQALCDLVAQRWRQSPEFATTQSAACGVRNSYDDPSRMGVDRWLAMLSAWHRAQQACWVVDCGSAITVEQLNHDGQHGGGYIMPGIQLMARNLLSNTAEIIVDHSVDGFDATPGVNTSEAVQHGLNFMLEALAEKLMRNATGQPVYVTGGDGELFCSLIEGAIWCPDLVLDGLPLALGE